MRNKYISFLSIVALLFVASSNIVFADGFTYNSSTGHYSLTLPSGWQETPKAVVDQEINNAVQQGGAKAPKNYTGFQVSDSSFPRMRVYEFDSTNPSYAQIEKSFADIDRKIQQTFDNESYPKFIQNATAEQPFIDKNRNIIFINIKTDLPNVGKVNMLTAYVMGKNISVNLSFYSLDSDYSTQLPVFNTIINSFNFEKGYEYDPALANSSSSSYGSLFVGAAALAIYGFYSVSKYKGKKQNKEKNTETK